MTFYSHTLYLLCASFVISTIVINLSRNRKRGGVPNSIKAIFLDGFIGKTFGGVQADPIINETQTEELKDTPFEEHRSSDDHQIIQASTKTKAHLIQNEWIRLAIIIDRITFIIYILIFIIMGFFHFV